VLGASGLEPHAQDPNLTHLLVFHRVYTQIKLPNIILKFIC